MKLQISKILRSLSANWFVWLFPLFAILISGWLFMEYLDQQGPTIRIAFENASSIREEKTDIRFKGVTIGTVKKIEISPDNRNVIVRAVLHKHARNFAAEGSRFWVVTPKVGFQGVSGLETLFEGPYIAALPGPPNGRYTTSFDGQIEQEPQKTVEDTSTYFLEAAFVESINAGDPVAFRGLVVGSVTRVDLSKSAQSVIVQIHIQNKYTRLVRSNTVFWRKAAVQAELGLFKSKVRVESLESALKGGIDFFTPDPAGPMAKARSRFALYDEPPKGWEKWNPRLEFQRSLRRSSSGQIEETQASLFRNPL